jgi:hypothetical protein
VTALGLRSGGRRRGHVSAPRAVDAGAFDGGLQERRIAEHLPAEESSARADAPGEDLQITVVVGDLPEEVVVSGPPREVEPVHAA